MDSYFLNIKQTFTPFPIGVRNYGMALVIISCDLHTPLVSITPINSGHGGIYIKISVAESTTRKMHAMSKTYHCQNALFSKCTFLILRLSHNYQKIDYSRHFTQIFVLDGFYLADNFYMKTWKSATGVQTGN